MSNAKPLLIKLGEWLFLAGVALLIVRNNSYPWPIKRASDILFLFALVAAAGLVFIKKDFNFFKFHVTKKAVLGLAIIFAGLSVAALSGYFLDGIKLTAGGILEIGRFVEAAIILLLIGFFEHISPGFYKKIAIAQLSTMVYLFALPWASKLLQSNQAMYRFQLFENWASNTGYYLIVSLSFLFTILLFRLRQPATSIPYLAAGAGLSGILLWTQTRAAWLGAFAAFILIIFFWAQRSLKKIALGLALATLLPILGFLLLPNNVKNNALGRLFPAIYTRINIASTPFVETIKIITGSAESKSAEKIKLEIQDERRVYLWRIYSDIAIRRPLGLGPSYDPLDILGAPQGPHNTILEYLVLGGPIALFGIISLFGLGFKNLLRATAAASEGRRFWPIYVSASLLGLAVVSMFDNMSTFRLMWIVLGTAIFYQTHSDTTQGIHPQNLWA